MKKSTMFQFGLETEYVLADRETYQPYWYTDVSFHRLNQVLEKIPLDGIPSLDGLELEHPHQKLMPYVVEGYHLPDMNFNAKDLLPKGVEIRTPVCRSIEECLEVQQILFRRLQHGLNADGLVAVALSHHPIEAKFRGPQNKRRHDFWLWAMEVMTTYGPDINVGIPKEMMEQLDLEDFNEKINYYASALSVFSMGSPFLKGKPWVIRGQTGKSVRTYRRSIIAPPIEVHPEENHRLEFKVFDMSPRLQDYQNFFLLFLTLLLDSKLKGRASQATRIYDQGAVAVQGWDAPEVSRRAEEILKSAERTLPEWGFSIESLSSFEERLRNKVTPADELLNLYYENHSDLGLVLRYLSELR